MFYFSFYVFFWRFTFYILTFYVSIFQFVELFLFLRFSFFDFFFLCTFFLCLILLHLLLILLSTLLGLFLDSSTLLRLFDSSLLPNTSYIYLHLNPARVSVTQSTTRKTEVSACVPAQPCFKQ